jgi:sugar phosphate isomerase/epimerase
MSNIILEDVAKRSSQPSFTLSAFADEISSDLDEQLTHLTQEEINCLEFRGVWGKNVLDLTDDELKRVASTLKAGGFTVSAIGSPIGKISITDPFEPHIKRFERALEIADWLGTSYIRMFSFFMPKPVAGESEVDLYEKYRPEVIARLTQLTEMTPQNTTLLHENEKDIYGDTAKRCADILHEVGSANLHAVFDPANFVQCGVKPFSEAYPLLADQITYVHIKDAFFDDGRVVVAGEGEGEVAEVLKALWQRGYQGYLSLEPHLASAGKFSGFSGPQLFHEAAKALKNLLAQIEA